jgi:hypothetical protein
VGDKQRSELKSLRCQSWGWNVIPKAQSPQSSLRTFSGKTSVFGGSAPRRGSGASGFTVAWDG